MLNKPPNRHLHIHAVISCLLDADFRGLASRQLGTFPHIGAYSWVWQNKIEVVDEHRFVIKSTDRNYDDVWVDLRKLNERQKQHLKGCL